jgi:hypothetical protein
VLRVSLTRSLRAGTVLMMFKLCRYPPDCPNHRYITGLLTSPLPSSSSSPAAEKKKNDERSKEEEEEEEQPPPWLEPITRRPLPRPLINATAGDSIEDPSNGWMDARGADHLSVFGPGKLVPLCVCPELGLAYRFVGFHVRTQEKVGFCCRHAAHAGPCRPEPRGHTPLTGISHGDRCESGSIPQVFDDKRPFTQTASGQTQAN